MAIRDSLEWEQMKLVGDDPESLYDIPALALRWACQNPL